jgi:NADPH:quinone reductase-like Zn-dependent oxidoreductase
VDFVGSLGADRVVDYTSTASMRALVAEGQQFDIIYDTVTSFAPEDPDYEPSMRPLLKEGGRYIAINGQPADWVRGVLDMVVTPLVGRAGLMQRKGYTLFLLNPATEMLDTVAGYFDGGLLREATIDSTFHLNQDEVYAAFDRIKGRRSVGKIVITIKPERRVRQD